MTGPCRGDRITFVWSHDGSLGHGVVTSRTDHEFFFRHLWGDSAVRFSATDAQEDCVWARGLLRVWWPPHWIKRKALVAAYALGDDKIHVSQIGKSFEESLAAAQRALNRDMRKLNADASKLACDAARLGRRR